MLLAHLGQRIGGKRGRHNRFDPGHPRRIPVDRRRTGNGYSPDARMFGLPQDGHGSVDIGGLGLEGILDGAGNRSERRLMKDHLDIGKDLFQKVPIPDIPFNEADMSLDVIDIFALPCCEIIKNGDGLSFGEKFSGNVGTDEASASGNEHGVSGHEASCFVCS